MNHSRKKSITSIIPTKCTFDLLNDDTLYQIFQFAGTKSYLSSGLINKRCNQIFLLYNVPKETSLYGYGSLLLIKMYVMDNFCGNSNSHKDYLSYKRACILLATGIVSYDRRDVLQWMLEDKDEAFVEVIFEYILVRVCYVAAKVEKLSILREVLDKLLHEIVMHGELSQYYNN